MALIYFTTDPPPRGLRSIERSTGIASAWTAAMCAAYERTAEDLRRALYADAGAGLDLDRIAGLTGATRHEVAVAALQLENANALPISLVGIKPEK